MTGRVELSERATPAADRRIGPTRPALTAEEWAGRRGNTVRMAATASRGNRLEMVSPGYGEFADVYRLPEDQRHSVAAECLHGQPFGFTREDVRLVLGAVQCDNLHGADHAFRDLADRISALLPPEGT